MPALDEVIVDSSVKACTGSATRQIHVFWMTLLRLAQTYDTAKPRALMPSIDATTAR